MKKNRVKILVLLMLLAGSASFSITRAFFTSSAESQNNTFSAKEFFPRTAPIYVSNPFTCATGATDTSTQKGTVTFDKNPTTFDISISVTSASANTQYQLWVNQDPGACPLGAPTVPSFLTTDGDGNGSGTLSGHGIVGGAAHFWISLVGGSDVFRSTAVNF